MKIAGVGIDLVNLPRIRKFLKTHARSRLSRLLSPSERQEFRKIISSKLFAKIFTAKEAYFKTLGESWMGLEGFASMEVCFLPGDRFKIQLVDGPLRKKGARQAEGCYFGFGNFLGAQVIRHIGK